MSVGRRTDFSFFMSSIASCLCSIEALMGAPIGSPSCFFLNARTPSTRTYWAPKSAATPLNHKGGEKAAHQFLPSRLR